MEDSVEVFEAHCGELLCGRCGYELECDDCGDMPDYCPECGAKLDWSIYDVEEE